MQTFWRAVALGALALSCGIAQAALPTFDLIEITQDSAIRWNFNSPGDIYVTNAHTNIFGDLTRLNDGRYVAYRGLSGSPPALYRINPLTGEATFLVEAVGAPDRVVAMAPMSNGNIFAYDNMLGFVSINPATLAFTAVPITPSNAPTTFFNTGGMATSPSGDIYGWCGGIDGAGGFSKLYKFNLASGTAQAIGGFSGLSIVQGVNAMSFTPDGRAFIFTTVNSDPLQPSSAYEVDPQTGAATFAAQRAELGNVRGIMFVPEPSMAVVVFGVLLFNRRRGKSEDQRSSSLQ